MKDEEFDEQRRDFELTYDPEDCLDEYEADNTRLFVEALRRLDAATAELTESKAISEGRLKVLNEKAEELRLCWIAKENAEGELAKRDAELKAARRQVAEMVIEQLQAARQRDGVEPVHAARTLLEWEHSPRENTRHQCDCGRDSCRGQRCPLCWQEVIEILEQRKTEP